MIEVIHADCLDHMRTMPDACVDAIVTDPPYGLSREPDAAEVLRHWLAGDDYRHRGAGFMGKAWDSFVPGPKVWREALRVLKPGGHLLAFFGTRTYDLGVMAVRLAGFEIRDEIAWLYGQGFPKSLDVSKAIDKAAGAEREIVGSSRRHGGGSSDLFPGRGNSPITAPATPEAAQWSGWGTALKPAHEPIVVARKPIRGTVAANVLAHGTGAINVDGCRIDIMPGDQKSEGGRMRHNPSIRWDGWGMTRTGDNDDGRGRWPANVVLDEEAAAMLDAQSGRLAGRGGVSAGARQVIRESQAGFAAGMIWCGAPHQTYDKGGGASRFFYVAKAGRADRGAGNTHPTVKPVEIMRWLVRLVTPPGGHVLDPFAGSGTTGVASAMEGMACTLIEQDEASVEIIRRRVAGPAQVDVFARVE